MSSFYKTFRDIGGKIYGVAPKHKLHLATKYITNAVGDRSWGVEDTQQAMLTVILSGRGCILNRAFIAETLMVTPMKRSSEAGEFVRSICSKMCIYDTTSPIQDKTENNYQRQEFELLNSIEDEFGSDAKKMASHLIAGHSISKSLDMTFEKENVYNTYRGRKWWNQIKFKMLKVLEN